MSKEVKINYNNTFATQHSRDYYRGASFHWSGEWMVGAHYLSDDYTIDYVVHGQVLLACAKSHLSTLDNEPKDFITDESGTVIGVVSTYWDFVLSGIVGKSPGIKIQDNYWYICKDTGVPEEQQVWENTGVKAKMELSDLTPEEIEILQRPGKEVVTEFINNTMTQSTGDDPEKIMSQKATTDALNTKASKSELSAAVENEVLRANEAYQPKGDYATNTKVDNLQNEVNNFEDAVDGAFSTVSEALDTLQDNIDDVANSIPTKVSELENDSRYQTKTNVETLLEPINAVIPQEATALNQLADKNFVTVSISDARAAFKGVSTAGLTEQEFFTWANSLTVDENDYVFWNTEDSTGNAILKRYYRSGSSWIYEYTLNNNSFTAAEWLAIKSGITADMIPSQASASNQLADKAFVNSSIATSTANFRGTSAAGLTEAQFLTWANGLTHDENDYVYWNTVDSVGNVVFKRYKYSGNSWVYEYDLNNSSFTANEWAAIQSGITSDLVTKLTNLPTNENLTTALNNKVDKVSGKQLSTEDYTAEEKQKLAGIASGAEVNVQSDWNVTDTNSDAFIKNKPENLVQDASYVHTDNNYTTAEKNKLSGIATSAQVNVLEGVQVNGTDLTITDKKVNVTVPTKTSQLTNDDNVVKDTSYVHTDNNYTSTEKSKLSGIEESAQVNKIEHITLSGTEQTITNKTVNLPAYPTTLPASDVYSWAKAATKPSYNFSEINGTVADSQLPDTISSDITGTAMGLKTEALTDQEFVYRFTPNTIKAKSFSLDRIYGKTLAWNQLVNRISTEVDSDNTSGTTILYVNISTVIGYSESINGHKLFGNATIINHSGGDSDAISSVYCNDNRQKNFIGGVVYGATVSPVGGNSIWVAIKAGKYAKCTIFHNIIDLTRLYGSAIDGLTDDEILAKFESEFPGYHDYNAGKLISNDAESIETVGFNVWDEEWEVGSYNSTGGKVDEAKKIRSKNFIKVLPSNTYYIKDQYLQTLCTYDENKNFLGLISPSHLLFTVPDKCTYITFHNNSAYGTTYNHDICINLSDPAKNGTYEPYWKRRINLNLSTLKDKDGNLVFPYGGMNGTGTAFDMLKPDADGVIRVGTRAFGRVDLGSLVWSSGSVEGLFLATITGQKIVYTGYKPNDVCSKYIVGTTITSSANAEDKKIYQGNSNNYIFFKDIAFNGYSGAQVAEALSGVMLYYELATPVESELAEPLVTTMKAGTTEARISPNADGLSASFCCDMTYSVADYTEYADRAGALVKGASVDLTDITANGELSGNAFKVIAEHITKLTSRVEALENGIGITDTLSSNSVDSANGYYINGDKTVIIGSGAPTMVPAFAGQFYINTSGPALYYAVNNSATTDWKQA